jgi:hypothetical protein
MTIGVDPESAGPRHLLAPITGVALGTLAHVVGFGVFVLTWWYQRVEAPTCFPDGDGVFITLVFALVADLTVAGVLAARYSARRFLKLARWVLGGWLGGLIVVVIGVADVMDYIQTLGMGCGGGPSTPWSS